MPEERPYSIFLEHRPRRIAFLLDPDKVDGSLLDAIVDFNIDRWGGRYNPIVPTTGSKVYPDYWRFLALAEPDVVYCCGEIDQETVERLDFEVGPTLIQAHRDFGARAPVRISVEDQASTAGVILGLRDLFPAYARHPEPSLLTFDLDHSRPASISTFVRRTFGVSWNGYFLTRDRGVAATRASTSEADVLHIVGTVPNLVLPVDICRQAPLGRLAQLPHSPREFTICYGNCGWNFVHFWNEAYFMGAGGSVGTGIDQMWLPPGVLEDKGTYDNLLTLIRRRVYSGNGQRMLGVVSYDHEPDELRELAGKLCSDLKCNLRPGRAEKLERGALPTFEASKPISFARPTFQHEHVRGKRTFIGLERPKEISSEGAQCWMVDMAIEDSIQEAFFANAKPWWKLPQRGSLAGLFTRPRPSRVARDGRVSVEVATQDQKLALNIPGAESLFASLLSPEPWYTLAMDLRHASSHPPIEYIRLSDKGKYLNGVLALFPSLREAVYFFEHPFWREALGNLCNPRRSGQVRATAAKEIRKHADEFIRGYESDRDGAADWLTEMVVRAGEKLPGVENSLSYVDLQEAYRSHARATLPPEATDDAPMADLRAVLSDLTRYGVLLQGSAVRCGHCLSEFWYHVDELGKTVRCKGCRREISLPAEGPWSYRPNELLRRGLRDYGLLPVVRSIGRLFEKSHDCFVFLSGVELGRYRGEEFVPEGEIDLSWILDGEFGMAEVKNTSKRFSSGDIDRLVKRASIARPGRVLLAATEGDEGELERWRDRAAAELKPLGVVVEAWGPSFFRAPSPYFV